MSIVCGWIMNKKSTILISVLISVAVTLLIAGGIACFTYKKYENIFYNFLKTAGIQELIKGQLKKYVDSGSLKELVENKLSNYTGGKVTVENTSYDESKGLFLENIEIQKGEATFLIKNANITHSKGIDLNGIVKTGKTDRDKILIDSAQIDLKNVTLNEITINPTSTITLENPKFLAEKIVFEYDVLDLLNREFIIMGATVLTPELSLIMQEGGVWPILDYIKNITDKLNLPEYSELLKNGAVGKNATVRLIDKEFLPKGELTIAGLDLVIKPYSGSIKDLRLNGNIRDEFYGNYDISGRMDLNAPKLNLKVTAKDLSVSEDFLRSMPVLGEKFWNTYKPNGKVAIDCQLDFDNEGGKKIMAPALKLNFNDFETTYKDWPITASRATGELIFTDNKININGMEGYVFDVGQQGANVKFNAILELGNRAKELDIKISDIVLTEELKDKLPDVCRNLWHTFNPGGQGDVKIRYSVPDNDNAPSDYVVEVNCKDWNITYPEIPIPVEHITGRIVISKNVKNSMLGECSGNVKLLNMDGYFNDGLQMAFMKFNGEFDMGSPKKSFFIDVPTLNITPELLKNLPEEYQKIFKDFTPSGQAALKVTYEHSDQDSKPRLLMTLDCKGCNFKDSRFPVPLFGVIGRIKSNGREISADHLIGTCFDGRVEGSMRMDIEDSSYMYKGDFRFSEMDMNQMFHEVFKTDQKWHGLLSGKINFHVDKNTQKELYAKGNIVLTEGNVSDVPIALSIINILNLGIPTKVVFNRGYINFTINGNIIEINEAKIYSDSVELTAAGKVAFDGRLDITVIVGFSNDMLKSIPLVGKLVDFVIGGVRKRLTKVHVGGTISKPESTLAMLTPGRKPIGSTIELLHGNDRNTGTDTAILIDD